MGMVVESLRRLEDSVARLSENVNMQLSRLPTEYVPRREVERRLDELTIDAGEERAERQRGIDSLRADIDKAQKQSIETRRWLIATTLTTVSAAAGVLFGILNHFQ